MGIKQTQSQEGVRWVHHVHRNGRPGGIVGIAIELVNKFDLLVESGGELIRRPTVLVDVNHRAQSEEGEGGGVEREQGCANGMAVGEAFEGEPDGEDGGAEEAELIVRAGRQARGGGEEGVG